MRPFRPYLFLALLSVALSTPAFAQWQNVGPNVLPAGDYGALAYRDGILWAGGDALVMSNDLGKSWSAVSSFPGRAVKDISFCDKLHGVVGTEGALYITNDGGNSWHAEFVAITNQFVQVYCGDGGRVMYALNFTGSEFQITTDGGANWRATKHGDVGGQTGHCFAIARDGAIYIFSALGSASSQRGWTDVSRDTGLTWTKSNFVDGDSYSLAADSCDASTVYLLNEDCASTNDNLSQVFRTGDAGGSWSPLNAATRPKPFYAGGMSTTAYTMYLSTVDSGTQNGVWRSTDEGVTWKSIGGPSTARDARSVLAVPTIEQTDRRATNAKHNDNTIFAIAVDGSIWATYNGGGDSLPSFPPYGKQYLSVDDRSSIDSLFAADTIRCNNFTRAVGLVPTKCNRESISGFHIEGADSANFSVVKLTSDSLYLDFHTSESDTIGAARAIAVIDFNDGDHDTISLRGFRAPPPHLGVVTTDVHTDTVGGTVKVPIVIQGLLEPEDIELVLHYESPLIYEGSFNLLGYPLDVPNERWIPTSTGQGRAKLGIAGAIANQVLGYARFTIFSDSDVRPVVTFDSLQIVNPQPCQYVPQYTATERSTSIVTPAFRCGDDILSRVLHGKQPLFTIRPNPASTGEISIETTVAMPGARIHIYDVIGVERIATSRSLSGASTPITISLPPGLYYVRIDGCANTRALIVR